MRTYDSPRTHAQAELVTIQLESLTSEVFYKFTEDIYSSFPLQYVTELSEVAKRIRDTGACRINRHNATEKQAAMFERFITKHGVRVFEFERRTPSASEQVPCQWDKRF